MVISIAHFFFCLLSNTSIFYYLDNGITHKVAGNHGAVAVENSQCSKTGLESEFPDNWLNFG